MGERSAGDETRTDYDETLDQEYDPIWLGGLNLHDELTARGLIKVALADAQIGEFVDLRGALGVMDFQMFRTLWDRRSVHSLIQTGVENAPADPKHLNSAARRKIQGMIAPGPTAGELISDIISAIPHRVQARLVVETLDAAWATLKQDSLVMDAADIYLKHGIVLDGRWRLFGVLDALPRHAVEDPIKEIVLAQFSASPFGTMATAMLPLLEAGFSRPPAAWGVTPLMIFRELSAR
jgi:hypothetical protein